MVSSIHEEPVSRSDNYKRVMKPLLERKRRARINRCLDELRDLLVSVMQSEGEAVTRLEKADILELTVRHVRRLSQRRRLALPTASVKHQQEQEDVVKFQQGFVAAAHQVQTFIRNTNSLEPTVSDRLLSHLTGYVTSITPPPTLVTAHSPATSPIHHPQAYPASPPQQQHVMPASTARPHMLHTTPPPPPPQQQQTVVVAKRSPSPPRPNTSSAQYSAQAVQNHKTPQQHQKEQKPTVPYTLPISASSLPPPPAPAAQTPAPHFQPPKPMKVAPQQPLIDLSNRQSQSTSFTGPIIRDVKNEDRMVAPSPFIDVVSTENDSPQPKVFYNNVKVESQSKHSDSNYDLTNRIALQLQAKMVAAAASMSASQAAHVRNFQQSQDFKNHLYAAAAASASTSQEINKVSSPPPAPQPPTQKRSLSPSPEDLSIKKFHPEDMGSSWRPW